MPITISLNGSEHELRAKVSVLQLLNELGLAQRHVAVEVNHAIVPRSQHPSTMLGHGDCVELVQAMGGG